MPIELTIILKNEAVTFRHKHLIYEIMSLDKNDAILQRCLYETLKEFQGEPDEVIIKTSMIYR